jgi:hypothetical protein
MATRKPRKGANELKKGKKLAATKPLLTNGSIVRY